MMLDGNVGLIAASKYRVCRANPYRDGDGLQ